jgi:hypothetical protein
MGIPPQTLASNPVHTFCISATFMRPKPSKASNALLAVTTCFPAASDRCMKLRAGPIPPTSSTTKSQPLLRSFPGCVVSRWRSTPGRSLSRSRTGILVMLNSMRARRRMSELFRATSSYRPRPTVRSRVIRSSTLAPAITVVLVGFNNYHVECGRGETVTCHRMDPAVLDIRQTRQVRSPNCGCPLMR